MLPSKMRGIFPEAKMDATMSKSLSSTAKITATRSATDTTVWDCDVSKLGLRHRGLRQTWIVQWRSDGRTRKQTLGRLEDMSRDDARLLARAILGANTPIATPTRLSGQTVASLGQQFLLDGAARWKPSTLRAHAFGILSGYDCACPRFS